MTLNILVTLLTVLVSTSLCAPEPNQVLDAISTLNMEQHVEMQALLRKIDETDRRAAATAKRLERKIAVLSDLVSAGFAGGQTNETAEAAVKLPLFASVSELPVDASGRLESHMLLVPEACHATASEAQATEPHLTGFRKFGLASDGLMAALGVDPTCPEALCLWKGAPPEKGLSRYSEHHGETAVEGHEDLHTWAERECEQVELGFRNVGDSIVDLYWLHPLHRDRVHQGRIKPAESDGDDFVFWRTVHIGHEFVAIDSSTGGVVRRVIAEKQMAVYTMPRNETLSAMYYSRYGDAIKADGTASELFEL